MIAALIILVAILVLAALYYRGNAKLKEFIHLVTETLNDNSSPSVFLRIEEAKDICRHRKGIVPYAMYCVITAMENINTEKK